MPKALKITLRALFVLLLIGLSLAAFVGYTFASDWLHQRRYVENFTYDPDRRYSPEALQEDFAIFRGALEESHGGLYWYTPKEEFDAAFEAAAEQLNELMTELEFVKVIAPLVDLIRDGHTQLRLPLDYLADTCELALWPLDLVVTERGTYVERDGSHENVIPPGSELLTLNGQEIRAVEDEMLALFETVDGYATQAKLRSLHNRNFFALSYGYLQGFPNTFAVTYTEPDSEVAQSVTLAALTLDESDENTIERYGETSDTPTAGVDLSWRGEVPVLTVSSFYAGEFDDYADALENAFTEIERRGAEQLVLDIRENRGGERERANFLFTYLHPEPYPSDVEVSLKTKDSSYLQYTEVPWENRWVNYVWFPFFDDYSPDPETGRWWRDRNTYTSHKGLDELPSTSFEGQVYLLLNGGVFSAGATFATMAKEQVPKLVIVGQETGGAYWGNTAGMYYHLILPNTHLALRLPRIKHVMTVEGDNPPGRGTLPDFEVWPTQEDIAAGRDTVLEYALDLAKKRATEGAAR